MTELTVKRDTDSIPNQTFIPESLIEKLVMAGLLARPVFFDAFPSLPIAIGIETVARCVKNLLLDLQLRVQLPICTGFPLYHRAGTIARQTNNQ